MTLLHRSFVTVALLAATGLAGGACAAELSGKSVVLVHGAWSNSSAWDKVIPLLEEAGLTVVSVNNPLASLEGDVANTRRVIDDQTQPVLLVGHSYGGVVITEAGLDEQVKGLVYVAAFAPEPNQSTNMILSQFPAPAWLATLHADAQGFAYWPADAMEQYFAAGLTTAEVRILAASQGPVSLSVNDDAVGAEVAYANKPTWSVVAEQDQIIPAPLQMHFADVMKSTVISVDSGHLPMLVKPAEVAAAIITAAAAI
jgi:pimeloyl-ACP methyl ester carboxylesterase